MKISVILGHPYEKSLNAAIAETVRKFLQENGYQVCFHDLYKEKFNPVISGQELVTDVPEDELTRLHQREIREADGIIIVHPNWWGQPPAMLKGWVDRVLREEVAYTFPEGDNGGGLPIGLLKAKAALVFNTSNTPKTREEEAFGCSDCGGIVYLISAVYILLTEKCSGLWRTAVKKSGTDGLRK